MVLCVALIISCASIPAFAAYSNASDWAKPELDKADRLGLIPATIIDNMKSAITREEFAELSVRVYEKFTGKTAEMVSPNPFGDSNNTEVLKAYKLGIVNGMALGKFEPTSPVSREQIATMLYRTVTVMAPNTDMSVAGAPVFLDNAAIQDYAVQNVAYMAKAGFIKGSNGEFLPKATATREQAVLICVRMFEYFVDNYSRNVSLKVSIVKGESDRGEVTITKGSEKENAPGSEVSVKAVPKVGYSFEKWVASDDAGAKHVSLDQEYKFKLNEDVTLYAVFVPFSSDRYDLTVNVVSGQAGFGQATITKGSASSNISGSEVTVKAIPEVGHQFVKWVQVNNAGAYSVSDKAEFSFKINNNVMLYAVFTRENDKPFDVSINVTPVGGGTVQMTSGSMSGNNSGDLISVNAVPSVGYKFVKWLASSDANAPTITGSSTYAFHIYSDVTIYAVFEPYTAPVEPKEYKLTAAVISPRSGNTTDKQMYCSGTATITSGTATGNVEGSIVTVSAMPVVDYEFDYWTTVPVVSDNMRVGFVSDQATYSFHISDDTAVYAVFKPKTLDHIIMK